MSVEFNGGESTLNYIGGCPLDERFRPVETDNLYTFVGADQN